MSGASGNWWPALFTIRPRHLTWWMASFFMIGSLLFAAGSSSVYADAVDSRVVAMTFFIGSLFFTSAAYMQLLLVVNEGRESWRFWAWEPNNRDWLASVIQLVGTVLFNLNTYDALLTHLSQEEQLVFVWVPDLVGSICFLAASWLALRSPSSDAAAAPSGLAWWIAALNMLGSVTFGLAAAGALFQIEGAWLGETIANQGTLAGAVCFFFGAWLVLPVSFATKSVDESRSSGQ